MSEGRQGWSSQARLAVAVPIVLAILLFGQRSLREPWVRPLPGVRVEMTRPVVTEEELGPDSAYRLLLKAAEQAQLSPGDPSPEQVAELGTAAHDTGGFIWRIARKLHCQPWPTAPPPTLNESLAALRETGWGKEPVKRQAESVLRDMALAFNAPWTLERFQIAQSFASLPQQTLGLIDGALAAPVCQMPTRLSNSGPDVYEELIHPLVLRLSLHAHREAAAGNYASAFQDVSRALGLANLVSRGGGLDNHSLVEWWDQETTLTAYLLARTGAVPVPILKRAAADFLAQAAATEPFVEIIRADAMLNLAVAADAYAATEADLFTRVLPSTTPAWQQRAVAILLDFALWSGSNPQTSTANLRALSQHLVILAEQPYSPRVRDEYGALLSPLKDPHNPLELTFRVRDPMGLLMLQQYYLGFALSHVEATRRDAERYGTALFLAIKAYEQEQGELPPDLAALVPGYLPRIPPDPFGGRPFGYLHSGVPGQPPGTWAIYSIGEDSTDDGGRQASLEWPFGRDEPGHDLVWPSLPPADR